MREGSIDPGSVMAGSPQGGGDGEVSLNMPRKSAHDMWLMKCLTTLNKFDQIIFTMAGPTDPRVVPYTRNCINCVLDDSISNKLHEALNEALDYITKSDLDPNDKGSLQVEACQMAVGQVNKHMDEVIGLIKTNAIVPISSDPSDAEVAAAMDILRTGGDLEVGGEEMTDPEKLKSDPETISQDEK